MESLDKLEQFLSGLLGRLASTAGGPHAPELVEVRRSILREIAGRIETKGRGEYFFPYTSVAVELYAPDAERRDALEAALGGGALEQDVREMMAERGCPDAPRVSLTITENAELAAGGRPWRIQWSREQKPDPASAQRPAARIRVLQGAAAATEVPSIGTASISAA